MKIRKATIKDLETIQKLNTKLCTKECEEFDGTLVPDYPLTEEVKGKLEKRILGDLSAVFVVEVENKIIGYIVGGIQKDENYRNVKNICGLGGFWVDEEYRNEGVGSKLFEEFQRWCENKDTSRLQVTVSSQNLKAIKFYKKEGFEKYDVVLEKVLK